MNAKSILAALVLVGSATVAGAGTNATQSANSHVSAFANTPSAPKVYSLVGAQQDKRGVDGPARPVVNQPTQSANSHVSAFAR